MALLLFLDTETTGLPSNWSAPITDFERWPRAIEVAWCLCREDGSVHTEESFLVEPDDWHIGQKITELTGLTHYMLCQQGLPIRCVLTALLMDLQHADLIVCHNTDFDLSVLGAEYYRQAGFNPLAKRRIRTCCTMRRSTRLLRIPKDDGWKWPNLGELYEYLFAEKMPAAHRAAADVEVTRRCFFEMRARGWPLTVADAARILEGGETSSREALSQFSAGVIDELFVAAEEAGRMKAAAA
jgi:DNA polymerase III alpha subunit (gram-positive type)